MEFTPINGLQIRRNFYTNSGCVLEDVIENHFYNYFSIVNPLIVGRKESIGGRPTDGIIRFYDVNHNVKFWILQETKRDKGLNSVEFSRSLLQAIMYLGNVFYDMTSGLGVDDFKGIFLDSARYFVFIDKSELIPVMKRFEPLWNKYFRVAPSKAYKEDELSSFICLETYRLKMHKYALDEKFRLDIILRDIYENNI